MNLRELANRFKRTQFLKHRVVRYLVVAAAVLAIVSASIFGSYYHRYSRMIDQRLNGHVFENTAKIYDSSGNLLTNLSGEARSKRQLVEYKDIPKALVDAVTAGEDQKFFVHHGLDLKRIIGAFIWNVRENGSLQGASTITQQVARSFFLTRERTLKRKVSEAFIAVLLEMRLSKEQIFTMYANEVYLGERDLFAMHGFGEAAKTLFGKELRELTLAETATLAGIIPAPNAFSPAKHPDRAVARRNLILKAMREAGSIKGETFEEAKLARLEVAPPARDVTESGYFVDFARDELLKNYSEEQVMYGGYSVYTTLDANLQKAAVEALAKGVASVKKELAARSKKDLKQDGGAEQDEGTPQAALIALDPRTGEIKALVGGSDYAASQFNRITEAFRQPGSVFKPFVYAAALETGYNRGKASTVADAQAEPVQSGVPSIRDRIITPATRIMDAPRAFNYGDETYEPNNFKGGFGGLVTLRTALQKSLNSAAVQVAERIGYKRVANFAHRMGLNDGIRGFPSVALGSFEVTPIELAGAYTAFANEGKHVDPHVVRRVETPEGRDVTSVKYEPREVLRPQIAYLMTYLMEGVVNRGTGAGVRSRGFRLPAAGKTGTSRDGWFAGYTKDLLVITWVGFDDNRDLNLEGSKSALPIWTDFMLKAYSIHPPSKRMYFTPPPGIEFVDIDPETMQRATPDCPESFQEAFLVGTAPSGFCPSHSSLDVAGDVNDHPFDRAAPIVKTSVSGTSADLVRAKPDKK